MTIALPQNARGSPDFREPSTRFPVPKDISPDERLDLHVPYFLPEGADPGPWFLDLLIEWLFWPSQRGTEAAESKSRPPGVGGVRERFAWPPLDGEPA